MTSFNQNNRNLPKLKLLAINVNSIVTNQKRYSLTNILKKYNPDVALLSETKLKQNHIVNFKDYNIVRNDRTDRQRSGTAIIIKRNIDYKRINIYTPQNKLCLENTIIKLKLKTNIHIFLIATYAPCGNQKEFIPELDNLFKQLQLEKEENYYIIAGDLNAKHTNWLNKENNPRGLSLNKWLVNNEFQFRSKLYCTQFPSYPLGESYLDIIIADVRIDFNNTVDSFKLPNIPYDSDHNAVLAHVSFSSDIQIPLTNNIKNQKYNYKLADWEKFTNTLKHDFKLEIPNDKNLTIQETIEYLQKIDNIKEGIKKVIPKVKLKNSVDSYLNSNIINLQKFKSHVLTQLHRQQREWPNVNENAIRILKKLLQEVKSRLKIEFVSSVNKYWEGKIRNIPVNNSASMFPQVNSIFRKKDIAEVAQLKITEQNKQILNKYNVNPKNTLLNENKDIIINNIEDKLNIIGAFFANINNDNKTSNTRFEEIIERKSREFINATEIKRNNNEVICTFDENNTADNPSSINGPENYFTRVLSLGKKFKHLNNKKSSGIDKIPNIVLKHLPTTIIRAYAILFNNLLNYRYFPPHWKKAIVVPILKKNKENANPLNYRPISLLPNISKVYEMIINDAILAVCSEKDILPENQFGFRSKHSTLHAINKLTSDICWALNDKKCVGACLIDLEKAFDSVWLSGLIVKLNQNGFPEHMIELIWNMTTNRSFVTATGTSTSSIEFTITNGLQQGTVNSPILFNIYTCYVLKFCNINSICPIKSIAFADDLIIYHEDTWPSRIQSKLQDAFERINTYYKSWKLKININKCETILFRQNLDYANKNVRRVYKIFALKEENEIIPHKNYVRYLGVHLDEKLKFNIHIETQLTKAKTAFFKYKRLFYSKILNKKIKIICYLLLIRPIITYGCPIWYNISASQMEKIRLFERKCLRICLRRFKNPEHEYCKYYSNKTIYDKANIPRIDNFIIKLTRDHFANATHISHNSLIFSALYPHPEYHAKTLTSGFIPPEAFPYLDAKGYIQDINNIPTIYHIPRHKNIKK